MPPQDNTKTKKRILLCLVALTVAVLVATLVFSNTADKSVSQAKQYQLENSIFLYKLPIDFEPVSSTRESVVVSYIGEDEALKGSKLTIGRYLKKESSNETVDRLKEIVLSSADGKIQTEKTTSESKVAGSKTILTVSDKSEPNKVIKYLMGDNYIWRIQVETRSEEGIISLQKTADLIAESIVEK
jgi:hypothetical protein